RRGEPLENRWCPSTVRFDDGSLRILGTEGADTVVIVDDGKGGVTVTFDNTAQGGNGDDNNGSGEHSGRHHGGGGDNDDDNGNNNGSGSNDSGSNDSNNVGGPTTETFTGVEEIRFRGLGGDDNVTYRLSGELTTDRDVRLDLGSGNDTATIDLAAGVNGAELRLFVNGGQDDDKVNITLGAVTDGDVTLMTNLGSGNDTLQTTGTGELTGFAGAQLMAFGGGGDDTI